jgi:hypothetical protein
MFTNNKSLSFILTAVLIMLGLSAPASIAAPPQRITLNSVNPSSGQIGSAVTLSGSGFSATASANKVIFPTATGSVNAAVTSASSTALTVNVPNGAVSGKVAVQVNNAKSNAVQFNVAAAPAVNKAPMVNAGADQTITLPSNATLTATATDDGLPAGSSVTVWWTQVSGPGTVSIAQVNALTTTAVFPLAGSYVMRFRAADGQYDSSDDVTVTVNPAGGTNPDPNPNPNPNPGGAPTVDAWPAKIIALPVRDVTLFGHASDPGGLPLTFEWLQTSGPAAVKFSAQNALTTTVSFTMAGVYGFELSASNGTSTVTGSTTVQVLSAESQTAYYVDPTYSGGNSDGSAARPWTTLDLMANSAQWVNINRSLGSNNVIIYFSARTAGSDTPESVNAEVNIWRTDGSKNRLTLDGMSRYNTNDAAGSWADYSGSNRFKFNLTTPHSLAIGVQSTSTSYPTNYTTIRGFEATGAGARVLVAGNDVTVEYVNSHDVTTMDPTFALQNAVHGDCTVEFGNVTGVTFRNNTLTNGMGEGFYVGSNYRTNSAGGCPSWGNAHSDVLLEGNVITNPGINGGQGDAIDLKAGMKNVTVRQNTISGVPNGVGAYAIVSLGTFDYLTTNANYLIEQNTILNGQGMLFQFQNGTIVRNNVVRNGLIYFSGNATDRNLNINLFNNTMYGKSAVYPTTGGFAFGGVERAVVKNNVIAGLGSTDTQISVSDSSSFAISEFNFFVTGAAIDNRYTLGAGDKLMAQGTAFFVNPSANDFNLSVTSPAANAGADLSKTGFWNDLEGQPRMKGAAWDAGAFKKKQ